jgi:hypothetical protein
VIFNGFQCKWGGLELYLTLLIELLPSSQIDTSVATVTLSAEVSGQETALIIGRGNSWLINSNIIHPEAAYILSNMLGGSVNRPSGANVVFANGTGLIFAEYDTQVDVDIPWTGTTHLRRYNPQGETIIDADYDLDGSFSTAMQRGELVILTGNINTCCVGIRGNVDGDQDEAINILDITYLIDFLYASGSEPNCLEEADVDGSGVDSINIIDVTYLINYLYYEGPPPPECP